MIDRVDGRVAGFETAIGTLPDAGELNLDGLKIDRARLDELLAVDNAQWQDELAAIGDYLDTFAPRLPERLRKEQQRVAHALSEAAQQPLRKAASS